MCEKISIVGKARGYKHWAVRSALRWLSVKFDQQCSGKQWHGYGLEHCQQRAFHEGPCTNYLGEEFRKADAAA